MNLFELFVKIGVDDQASKNISSIAGKLGNGLKTAAKIGTAAVTTAAAGITALTTAAVKNYAEYEQLVGGVETLFKKSSEKVQKYAANAYKTAGLSANEYMSTVTSFSASLLQSLKGDTEKAAEYADMAVSDMSDNANKMGTDMELIQNAYQGFAKQNYTMLDNLKLGYGGTKTEMERLVKDAAKIDKSIDSNNLSFGNIVKSINVVQREMGIYGTTALEAEKTISGSLNAMKGAWSNLITGVADENANFEELIDNMIDSVGTFGGNIIPRVEQGLLGISKLIEKTSPKIVERIPKILNDLAPKLLKSGINILKNIVKGISKNAKIIVKAAKDLILDFIDGMVNMLPDVIDAAVELLSGIIEAIPDVVTNIGKNIPKIIDAIVTGLAKGTSSVVKTVGKLFGAFDDGLEEASGKLAKLTGSFTPFMEAVSESANKTKDLKNALSKSGKTISDLDDKISKTENSITEILKKAFQKQDGLRQSDLDSIRKYRAELIKLQEEKLSIYQEQQLAELRKTQFSIGELSVEDAKGYLGQSKAALEESNKIVEEIYNSRLTTIENYHKTRGTLESNEYKKEIAEAKNHYEKMKKENQRYYDESVGNIEKSSDKWIETEAEKWSQLATFTRESAKKFEDLFNKSAFGWEWASEKNKKFFDSLGGFDSAAAKYANALSKMDLQTANAFLSMQATVTASGGVLDKQSQKAVNNILNAFGGLPETMDDEGRKALNSLISGLESQIPELKNSSEMTTDEILKILRKNLLNKNGKNPSKEIGVNIAKGVSSGLDSGIGTVLKSVTSLAKKIISKAKSVLKIQSPSKIFKNEIGKQIVAGLANGINEFAYMADDAVGDLSESIVDNFDTDTLVSTSTNSISDFNNPYDYKDVSNSKTEVVVSIDDSANAMGLARALLPFLKIAEKEAYT